jgi:hypothetical protein
MFNFPLSNVTFTYFWLVVAIERRVSPFTNTKEVLAGTFSLHVRKHTNMKLRTSTRHHALNSELSFMAIEALVVLLVSYIRVANAQDYDYTGGVALRYPNDTCPYNTDYIGTSFYPNCCPSWTVGAPSGSGYCCASKGKPCDKSRQHFSPARLPCANVPRTVDCYVTVASAPKCADPSWTYCYDPDSDAKIGFCCLQGWHCEVEKDASGNSLGVGCNAPNRALASTQSAAITSLTAYQIPGATSTSTATTTSSAVRSTTNTGPTASAQTTANTQSSTGLSTGAKAGISVGAAIGGLALIGLVAWLMLSFLKRRDRVASSAGDPYGQPKQGYGEAHVAPKFGEMSGVHHDPRELDGQAIVHRSELEGSQGGHEMGDTRKWR